MRERHSAQQGIDAGESAGVRSRRGSRYAGPGLLSRFGGRHGMAVAVAALLLGACVFAYPMVSNYIHQMGKDDVVDNQVSAVSSEDDESLEAERQRAVEYNQKLLDSRSIITDPFDPSAQRVTDSEYESVLNINGDGVMGTITIPKIHVEMPIYHGTSSEVLQNGVGHLQETSVPIGGESTHAVLSGHTGLPSMKVFDNLDELEVGDYFIISVLGEDHAYRVTSTEVVLPDETDSLAIQEGKDLVTLVTCTPYGINTHRLLVHAERCPVPEEWLDKGDSPFPSGYSDPPDKALLPSIVLGLLLAVLVIGGYLGVTRLREARKNGALSKSARAGARRGQRSRGGALRGETPASSPGAAPGGIQGVVPVVPATRRRHGETRGHIARDPMGRARHARRGLASVLDRKAGSGDGRSGRPGGRHFHA